MPEFNQGYFLQIYANTEEQWMEIYDWLHDNVGSGNYQIKQCNGLPDNIALFKNEEDAMAFRLTFS